jgi:PKD repeat protein
VAKTIILFLVNASDGLDSYDIPNPPGGVSPVLDVYIPTDFAYPHNTLLREIKEHPDTNKEWDFTVQWIDGDTSVNVTMSWNTDEINDSEYNSVFLYDDSGTFLTDMSTSNNYDFLCSSSTLVDFKIVCSSTSNGGTNDSNDNSNENINDEENEPPTANALASETFGFVDIAMSFNGLLSTDIDGYITGWLWDFGDNNTGSGEITTHVYSKVGTYAVTLTVFDDKDTMDTDTIIVVIVNENNVPTEPVVNGTTKGNKNTEYTYTAVSTDSDNDTISYIFEWGDDTITTSEFLPNGTEYVVQNKWTAAGIYTINITATDNKTTSEQTTLIILIDACFVGTMGYLIDSDGDGTYDLFHINATGVETFAKKQKSEQYLLDVDGDGNWDHIYDQLSGATMSFNEEIVEEGSWIIIVLMVITLAGIAGIVYFYKKNYL